MGDARLRRGPLVFALSSQKMTTCLKAIFVLIAFAFAQSAFSQASFLFWNYHPSVDAPVFDADGARLFGTNYVSVLYGGNTSDSLALAQHGAGPMQPVPFTETYNGQAGYFFNPGSVWFSGVPGEGFAWLQVRAWDLRLGETYDEVTALGLGGYGQSRLFYARGGDVGELDPPRPLLGLQSFSLVPEPTTYALLVFGAGFLCWRCRRKT